MTGICSGTSGTVMPSRSAAGCACGPDGRGHPGDDVAQHRQHVAVVADEAELDVQRHVLGQVPRGVVRLGPEHRAGLVDALEHADHRLLVELRRLGEVRRAAEVVDLEHVGAATRWPRATSLGVWISVKPRPSSVERKPRRRRGGQLPLGPLGGMAPGHGGVVEQRGQPGVQRGPPQLDRRGLRGLAQRRDRRLRSPRRRRAPAVRRGGAGDRDRRLLAAAAHRLRARWCGRHLGQPGPVADDQEGDRGQLPAAVDPAFEPDLAAWGGAGQLSGQGAGQGRRAVTVDTVITSS